MIEHICWAIFSIICTVGFFVAFHYDLGDGRFYFDFSDVPMTTFKVFCAMLVGMMVAVAMVLVWPAFLGVFIIIGISFGIAYGLKRFFAKKG